MRLARALLLISVAVFAVTGIAYLVAPGQMLSIVGIPSTPTSDFLLRKIGVALLCGAGFLWAIRAGRPEQLRVVLIALGAYYFLSSAVDLSAFVNDVVGLPSVPSAALRIAVGVVCLLAAARVG